MFGQILFSLVISVISINAGPRQLSSFDGNNERNMHAKLAKSTPLNVNLEEYQASYWIDQARDTIAAKKNMELNKNIAKNVIMFLGDGMSIATLKAARVYMGQLNGEDGEGSKLAMEKLPYSGFSKAYCLNAQVPCSACSATAYLRGVKANYGTVGVGGHVERGDCAASKEESNRIDSIATWSQAAGKRTGIVTTTRITDASPAGTYAYSADRSWESDFDMVGTDVDCEDTTYQFVYSKTSKNFNVALGGGRENFLPNTVTDEEGVTGIRLDGRNLIEEWLAGKEGEKASYVWNKTALFEVADDSDYILGLFEDAHMKYYLDDVDNEDPTLEEMTEIAIKVLSKEENGYFLFVEGGKIDKAHHETRAKKALAETIEFSKAIEKALELTTETDTLIVVTSDHSHVMSIAGYGTRGEDIMGIAGSDDEGIPYPVLSYANGPGYREEEAGERYDFSQNDFTDKELMYPAMVPKDSETHSGEDVGIFASGPWAHLFSGVIEQNVIAHIMAFASCVGAGATACD